MTDRRKNNLTPAEQLAADTLELLAMKARYEFLKTDVLVVKISKLEQSVSQRCRAILGPPTKPTPSLFGEDSQ